jgi:hypothetical protein
MSLKNTSRQEKRRHMAVTNKKLNCMINNKKNTLIPGYTLKKNIKQNRRTRPIRK